MTNPVELVIKPRTRDLGGFEVARVLPYAKRRTIGPFIFFDRMGPNSFGVGEGIDVRPHPHVGLATVTYLFEGEIMHRDSLGYALPIQQLKGTEPVESLDLRGKGLGAASAHTEHVFLLAVHCARHTPA